MAGKPYKSCLLPYLEFIREARANGVAYAEIARELKEKFNLECTRQTIFYFVKSRSKSREVIKMLDKPNTGNITVPFPEFHPENILAEQADEEKKKEKAGSDEQLKEDLWSQVQEAANFDYTKKIGTWVEPKGGAK